MGKSAKGTDGFVSTVKVPTDVHWEEISDRPNIPPAQVQSDWNAITGLAEILNKPTIPSNTNQLTNGNGFITSSSLTWDNITGKPTIPSNNNELVNGSGYITLSSVTWDNTAGKPNFANVATTGSYNDLTNKPTLFSGDYTPGDASSWASPAPTTITQALDRLAAKIAYLNNQGYVGKP